MRPSCLYCGAPLASDAVEEAARSAQAAVEAPREARPARMLLLVDLAQADPRLLAERLGIPLYDARQRAARGGVRLHRCLAPDAAAAAAEQLRGLRVFRVPEEEIEPALRPVRVRGGVLAADTLELRGPDGPTRVLPEDVVGLVRGPIAREYAAAPDVLRRRTLGTARLEPGYRFQLHRREGAPVELDPWAFEFPDRELGRSTLLTLTEWALSLARHRPQDDGFRLEPPALAPAEEDAGDARRALGRGERRADAPAILDNVRQFRFYSGWRAALMRRGV